MNLAYDEDETRGFLKLRGLALALTVTGVVALAVVVAGLIVFPELLSDEGTEAVFRALILAGAVATAGAARAGRPWR